MNLHSEAVRPGPWTLDGLARPSVCIVGAGAIGGLIGSCLAATGAARVQALARGATLAALRRDGWQLQIDGAWLRAPAPARDDPVELGPQDLVIIAVKGPALSALAPQLRPLIGTGTLILPAMNGVPWWFCDGQPGFGPGSLASVDPGGRIGRSLPPSQVLGCVVHASAACPAPGIVQHRIGRRLLVGEPAGGLSARASRVAALLAGAGFEAEAAADVRQEIWFKLWGNLTMNPVSALTGATVDRVLGDPLLRRFCSAAMAEAAVIGAQIGCRIAQSPEDRHAVTARLGAFKTSMLQDVEAGRAIELDAIVTAVHEIGRKLGIDSPHIDALLGLTRVFAQVRGLLPGPA
jgi:2-dehydropantoate 2-reductase